jgi:glucan biosynthesis protein C
MPEIENPTPSSPRRHDLDWLRIAAVAMLVPYHTSRIFDSWEPFYVKNLQISPALTVIRAFLDPWGMPLLFVIAGASTWLALRRRTGIQYLRERVLRLIIPLLFGLVVVVPPQAYLAWLGQGGQGSYPEFFGQYWGMQTGEFMGFTGGFTFGHLWFILFLFAFSLAALPVFLFLRSPSGSDVVRWVARLSERPAAIFFVVIPFWLTEPLPGPLVGRFNPFAYIFLFVAGFVLIADTRFQVALDRTWRWALALGTITLLALAAIRFSGAEFAESSWQSTAGDFLQYFSTWAWVVGTLGLAHCHLNRSSRLLPYFNAASYPFYVLHQTVILLIGYYVTRLNIGVLPKFLIIAVAALAATLGLYEMARRWGVTRALLGIKAVDMRRM